MNKISSTIPGSHRRICAGLFSFRRSSGKRHDPDRAHYQKKSAQPTVANSRRMVHHVYAVLKRGTPYVPALSTVPAS